MTERAAINLLLPILFLLHDNLLALLEGTIAQVLNVPRVPSLAT